MSKFYMACGISGSGKSTFGNTLKSEIKDLFIVCPDDIRKELTGNISDQSKNEEVWQETYRLIREHLRNGENVYLSATNLNRSGIKFLLKIAKRAKAPVEVVAFEASRDWNLCYSRVKADIDNNVDRSNTLCDIEVDEEKVPLIKHMSEKYIELMDSDFFEKKNVKVLRIPAK